MSDGLSNFLTQVWDAVYKGTGAKQTVDVTRALTSGEKPDGRAAVRDWIEGVDAATGQPSAWADTRDALFNKDWHDKNGNNDWITRSWAHVNSKDNEPIYKYSVEEPLNAIIGQVADWLGMEKSGVVSGIAGIGGTVGGMDWGAGLGAGLSDVTDANSGEAVSATAGGLASGAASNVGSSGSSGTEAGYAEGMNYGTDAGTTAGDYSSQTVAADYGWSDAATAGTSAADSYGFASTSSLSAESLATQAEPGYGTGTDYGTDKPKSSFDANKTSKALSQAAKSYSSGQKTDSKPMTASTRRPGTTPTAGEAGAIQDKQTEETASALRDPPLSGKLNAKALTSITLPDEETPQYTGEGIPASWYQDLYRGLGDYTY